MKKKKIFAITGIIAVSFSLLGCHKSTSTSSNEGGNGLEKFIEKQKENDTNINTDTSKDIDTDTSDSGESSFGNIDANTNLKDRIRATSTLFNSISEKYQETQLEEEYEKPMYLLPQDYVFEFDCSESAGNVSYKAFEVYDNSDFEQKNGCSYCTCSYEDGKIYVEPWGAIYLDESGSKNSKDGTWGSLNTLYLVQRIDLQTGEDLSKPKVTPFSIQHDVDAPTVTQGVTDENTYTLSWKPVAGAVEYRVYQYFSSYYELQCYTSDTSVTVEDFARQKESEKFSDLVKNDLENAGYEVERGTYLYMNSGARFDDDNGYYLVVAVDSNGKQSGISNIVDVRKVASRLPYYVSEKIEKKIVNIEDTPTYVGVEMVDGSTEQMLINYHGAKVTKLEDGDFIVDAHICNTKFDSFRMKFSGMSYEQFLEEASAITERQDQLNKSGGCMNSDAPVPNAPSNNRDEKNEELDEIKKQLELILPDLTVPTISVAEDSTDSENDVPEEI